jgi:adenylate cyclase
MMPFLVQDPDQPVPTLHSLPLGCNTIGREIDNSIVIADISLSRHHAELHFDGAQAILKDLHSLNHTFVNDQPIQTQVLANGDRIRFGRVPCQFWLNLPEALTAPAPKPQNWSIISRLSPGLDPPVLQSLLQDSPETTSSTILRLPTQNAEQRAVQKLQILLEVSHELSVPQPLGQLLEKILDLLFQIMAVDRAVILLRDPLHQILEAVALKFRPGLEEEPHFYSKTIVQRVETQGDAIISADTLHDGRFQSSQSILQQAIQASMCVPLKPRAEVIGVLYVDNLSLRNVYTQEDLAFLTSLANQAAIAIDNARLYEQIQSEAILRSKLERFFPPSVRQKLQEREENLWEIASAEVTILFADISNYTVLSSQRSPQDIIQLLNEYFAVMVEEIIFPHEGTLEKYVGDALLAFWGAPYPQADDAERALRAAIAMQQAVQKLNQRWRIDHDLEIAIHIGLNTGTVAAGNIGSRQLIQYAVIGDTTNVSSRICSAAQAHEILLSESTVRKLPSALWPLEALPPTVVKGKAEPLQLYRVLWQGLGGQAF